MDRHRSVRQRRNDRYPKMDPAWHPNPSWPVKSTGIVRHATVSSRSRSVSKAMRDPAITLWLARLMSLYLGTIPRHFRHRLGLVARTIGGMEWAFDNGNNDGVAQQQRQSRRPNNTDKTYAAAVSVATAIQQPALALQTSMVACLQRRDKTPKHPGYISLKRSNTNQRNEAKGDPPTRYLCEY
jgi:hypothetical protein